jgi:hypothetical protein
VFLGAWFPMGLLKGMALATRMGGFPLFEHPLLWAVILVHGKYSFCHSNMLVLIALP